MTQQNLTIKPSDKGGNILAMETSKYEKNFLGCLIQRKLVQANFSISTVIQKFYSLAGSAYYAGVVTKQIWEFIRISHPREACFYTLPKTHKNLTNPPGHPIVSSNGCSTENASQYIQY